MKWKFRPYIFLAPNDATPAEGGGAGTGQTTGEGTPPDPQSQEDVSGLKTALQSERQRASQLEKQFKALQETFRDVDPKKYQELQQLQLQAEELNQREAKLKSELEADFQKRLVSEQQKTQALQTQLLDLQKRISAEKAYQAANGRSGGSDDGTTFFDAFYATIGGQIRLNDKGQPEVIDAAGARRYSSKNGSEPMGLAEFFSSLIQHPVYAHYFAPTNNGKGGGMPPNGANGGGKLPPSYEGMSRSERITAARQAAGR